MINSSIAGFSVSTQDPYFQDGMKTSASTRIFEVEGFDSGD
jgi:hypothetical protein